MRGLFNLPRLVDNRQDRAFQSALRMRGLFNSCLDCGQRATGHVSIRLADAWPFQLEIQDDVNALIEGFNPPCGCVAFSTRITVQRAAAFAEVSIRLADAWPFQRGGPMPGRQPCQGFNPPCGCVAFSTGWWSWHNNAFGMVSIRLADAWPFQPGPHIRVGRNRSRFNPPCGCVAFSTPALATASGRHGEALLREARPERRAAP